MSWNYWFYVFIIIQPTYTCKLTMQWHHNIVAMISRPLCKKCICILGRSCPYFFAFWVNMGTYSVTLHIFSPNSEKVCFIKKSPKMELSTTAVINWFRKTENKNKYKFVLLDIKGLCWWVSKKLLDNSINFWW